MYDILDFLECAPGRPGVRHLNRLIHAYVRKVPWESAFRIAKRAETPETAQCPRYPYEFWRDAMTSGGGGTCFESNYAFFDLLKKLGYSGYLTVNDMGDEIGCHSAIVVEVDGRKVLVDVGIPLQTVLPFGPDRLTRRTTWLHTYTVRPDGTGPPGERSHNLYQIERSHHPMRNIYTLLDKPVPGAEYRKVMEQDYGEGGLFLDRVIIVKVIGDRLWRFNSQETPYRLEAFTRGEKQEYLIPPEGLSRSLAKHFQMDERKIEVALAVVEKQQPAS